MTAGSGPPAQPPRRSSASRHQASRSPAKVWCQQCAGGLDGLDLHVVTELSDWSTWAKLTQASPLSLPMLKAEAVARAKGEALLVDAIKATLGRSSATGTVRIGLGEQANDLEARLGIAPRGSGGAAGSRKGFQTEPRRPHFFGRSRLRSRACARSAARRTCASPSSGCVMARRSMGSARRPASITGKITADPVRILVEGRELRIRLNADASSGKSVALNLAIDGQGIPVGASDCNVQFAQPCRRQSDATSSSALPEPAIRCAR